MVGGGGGHPNNYSVSSSMTGDSSLLEGGEMASDWESGRGRGRFRQNEALELMELRNCLRNLLPSFISLRLPVKGNGRGEVGWGEVVKGLVCQ